MLTVWCVLNGTKYSEQDVYTLRSMVTKHLEQPHKFVCLADRYISGVDTMIPPEKWPGWWAKLLLFKYAPTDAPNLYLDLDTVVVGNLDRLVSDQLAMPANWAASGHGGGQSSVMAWTGDYNARLAGNFDPERLSPPDKGNHGRYQGLWGDQEYITLLMGAPGSGNVVEMGHVYSYKYHCRGNGTPPADASVVCFHGDPKPGKVTDEWVIDARCNSLQPEFETSG